MRLSSVSTPRRFRPLSLDALNFLLADVRGALGPYLNVFLVTQQHWSQSEVGLMTTIGGFLGLAVQTPIGAAIDETRCRRSTSAPQPRRRCRWPSVPSPGSSESRSIRARRST